MLHECVERVPENVDAAKELLMYGLKGTDLEALIAIGNREDEGRYNIYEHTPQSIIFFSLLARHLQCLPTFLLACLRFIMPGDVDLDDLPYEDILSRDEELEMKREREKRKRQELLAKIDFSRYTAGHTVGLSALLLNTFVENEIVKAGREAGCDLYSWRRFI